MRVVCEHYHWPRASYWRLNEPTGLLQPLAWWPSKPDVCQADPGTGLPPPAWLGEAPVWVGELQTDELAASGGQCWRPPAPAVVLPVRIGHDPAAVFAFEIPPGSAPAGRATEELRALVPLLRLLCRCELEIERASESERRYASTLALAAIGIAHVDDCGRFLYVNPQLCDMLGYSEPELLALSIGRISHPDDAHVTDDMRDQLRRGAINSFKMEKRYLRKDGTPVWVALTIAVRRDRAGHRLYDVSIVEDISARKAAEERVAYLATHDGLTGIPNRAMFTQLMALAIQNARRRNSKIAVLFIDLDRFKIINDTMGHEAGDVLLREIAMRFRDCLRATDIVARLGGDEFVALLPEVEDRGHISTVARNLLAAAMRPVEINHQDCRVTASIGICVHPEGSQDDESVLKYADMAMYLAKEEGKNTFKFYSNKLRTRAAGRLAIETHLRHALERGELSLHYQPKVNIDTDVITGVEALLRWNSSSLGPVSPVEFIPVAEETGLIMPIGRWVLRTACAQAAGWQRQGLPPVQMSVNISMRQLTDDSLIADIRACLAESALPPHLLELELTESMIMHNTDHALGLLTRIKALGVRLAIDDFGTGYSSLAQLKRYPIDTLKVDRSFIRDVSTDPEDRAITEAILTMGRTLSLNIVAEGVETPEQKAFLRERACNEMQGYYFSTPVSSDELATLLRGQVLP